MYLGHNMRPYMTYLPKNGMNCVQNWDVHPWKLKKCGVDSNIISNEEICGNNSSNDKIWWRPLPSDGTSLAIKLKINIRKLLRNLHALFWRPDEFLTRFWQKICEEDHPQTTHGILIISKQLKSVLEWERYELLLNCCWVEMSSESQHRAVLNKTKSLVEFF